MNDSCPKHWIETTLGEVAVWGSGGTPSRSNASYYGGDIPWIKTGELGAKYLKQTEEFLTAAGIESSSAKVFLKGSVAIAMYGATIGKTSILGIDASTNQACAVARPKPGVVDSEFLYYMLRSLKDDFVAAGQGGAQPNISQTVLRGWPIRLPPLAEQKRIADKLDRLLAAIDTCKARLDAIRTILKRFRQSVLAAAVGKYDGQTSSLKQVAALDVGFAFKSEQFSDRGVRLLRGDNIEPGRVRWRDAKCFPEDKLSAHANLFLREGDVVLAMDRPLISTGLKVARVTADDVPSVLVQRVARFRPSDRILSDFLFVLLRSDLFIDHLRVSQNGTQVPHISSKQILHFRFRLPPLREQRELVSEVDALLAIADGLEVKVSSARTRMEQLTHSLLSKALRGDLILQELSQVEQSLTRINQTHS